MCGACGRTVVADDVLGAQRTLRSQFIVVQTINRVFGTSPGSPSVQVAGDGWVLRTPTGNVHTCQTVHELWRALVSLATRSGSVPTLLQGIQRELESASGLPRAVLLSGQETVAGTGR
jgi:hypothetical protein